MGTECSSGVREWGRGISQKGMGACRFPITTEITELNPGSTNNKVKLGKRNLKSWNAYSCLGMISPVCGLMYPPPTLGQTTPVLGSITPPNVPGKNSPVRGLTTPFPLVIVEGPGGAGGAGCGVGPACMGE